MLLLMVVDILVVYKTDFSVLNDCQYEGAMEEIIEVWSVMNLSFWCCFYRGL